MLISKKWVSEFVKLPPALLDKELASRITLSTVEVESVKDQAFALKHIVVGIIKSVSTHPNADKLQVCQVDIGDTPPARGGARGGGSRIVQIVCGGTNVAVGMKVAVALPGAWVRWHGEGELVEIKKTKLRGEDSEGMICSSQEIGLSQVEGDHEIRNLGDVDAKVGTPLAMALGLDDVIFDIEHKSLTNRPDLMGHYGMAREVAALTKSKLAKYEPKKITTGKGMNLNVKVEDAQACPRYMAVAMERVIVGESPDWMKHRLEACGVRSINNVVDVTNYVMLELGQPMHAFDADILGGEIVVRAAHAKEKITALDEKTYVLDSSMLLITDGKKPMAIAGVMGGEGSGVSEKTTKIVFESANFNPVSVRKTSMKLALRSESSARFEKSLDPNLCELALRRAVELMRKLSPGANVASKVIDVYPHPPKPSHVSLSVDLVNQRLGTEIPAKNMEEILTRLGFAVKAAPRLPPSLKLRGAGKPGATGGRVVQVTIPSWRATKDVSIAEDVIEEIARVWGYEKIESTLPSFSIVPSAQDPLRLLVRDIRNTLSVGLGCTEVYRYAFVAPDMLRTLGFALEDHLKLANPLAEDRPYLCQSLVPNMFDTVAINHRSFPVVSVFEIARVFMGNRKGDEDGQGGTLPAQPYHLGIAYSAQGDASPIVELRQQVETTLLSAGFDVSFHEMEKPGMWMHPSRATEILVNGKKYGMLAEVRSDVAQTLGIDRRVAIAEMNVTMLAALERASTIFTPIPLYPDAKRDIAFTVGERTTAFALESAIRKASTLLVEYVLFDVYRGKGVEEGRKSMAVHMAFRSLEKTLEAHEVEEEMGKIRLVLEEEFGATIRS
ncbi:phenylalanine--tRNA ligase subunit beta [Patescibacteria group bacterium]|nr:MAG: phenylalanine--tRNA ligase subunit beta [Patescibacteria group bacterium]